MRPQLTADWLTAPASQEVCSLLTGAGYRALFVGGCVRNALLGAEVTDLDIATDALPEQVTALAEAAGLRAIPTGIEHGTVTVIAHGEAFEITTFRRDVATDGRRAVVRFSTSMEEDAQRRDFTVNALYAAPTGDLWDPVGGLADLDARVFRFIGDPTQRIREDYLRILRFFRFFAWYGDALDPAGLAACKAEADGLSKISKERITAELIKLLAADDPGPAVTEMAKSGVLETILQKSHSAAFAAYLEREITAPDAIARLAALGPGDPDGHLRLSRGDLRRLTALEEAKGSTAAPGALGYHLGEEDALRALALRAADADAPLRPKDIADVEAGARAVFPIKAADLPPELEGIEIGKALERLLEDWLASRFKASREELLASL